GRSLYCCNQPGNISRRNGQSQPNRCFRSKYTFFTDLNNGSSGCRFLCIKGSNLASGCLHCYYAGVLDRSMGFSIPSVFLENLEEPGSPKIKFRETTWQGLAVLDSVGGLGFNRILSFLL